MLVKGLTESMRSPKRTTSPYDTTATVVRVDGETAYVHIAGGVDETPVSKTVNCKVGDKVQVRVGGGRAWITGNATAPPTDDTRAERASTEATDFITDTANGIFVHRAKDKKSGVKITDIIEIIRGNKTVAEYGEVIILGDKSKGHLVLTDDTIKLFSQYGEILNIAKTSNGDALLYFANPYIENPNSASLHFSGLTLDYFGDDYAGEQYAEQVDTNGVYKAQYVWNGIYYNDYNEPVGTVRQDESSINASSESVANSTWHTCAFPCSITAGTWLVTFGGAFASNANGMRYFVLNDSDSSSVTATRQDIRIAPASGGATSIQSTRIVTVTEDTYLYLHVYQNSGEALLVSPIIKAVKLI
jgi:hypothetical protein